MNQKERILTWEAAIVSGCVIVVVIFVIIVVQNRMDLCQRTGLHLNEAGWFSVVELRIIVRRIVAIYINIIITIAIWVYIIIRRRGRLKGLQLATHPH